MTTIHEFAAKLNGREYGNETTKKECYEAKKLGFVIIYGYSDDNVELDGATTFKLNAKDVIPKHDDCECKYCGYDKIQAETIEAVWCGESDYSWTFKTKVPHATFDIMEDGETFCRGIVIDTRNLPGYVEQ